MKLKTGDKVKVTKTNLPSSGLEGIVSQINSDTIRVKFHYGYSSFYESSLNLLGNERPAHPLTTIFK